MGAWFGRFMRDQRGTSFEGIALSVSVIAVAFVASADMLDFMTKSREPVANVVTARRVASPAIPAAVGTTDLDQTPTASLPRLVSRSILDPCTGARK